VKIKESAENYLEAILMLELEQGEARSVGLANALGVSKPSVSYAMKRLRENGYVEMDGMGRLNLTESGRAIAQNIYEKHELLTKFLQSIGVDYATARADACRIEHAISQTSFEKIREHVENPPPGASRHLPQLEGGLEKSEKLS
jgi:Mn-dependent DtxR family transcriptional regulator